MSLLKAVPDFNWNFYQPCFLEKLYKNSSPFIDPLWGLHFCHLLLKKKCCRGLIDFAQNYQATAFLSINSLLISLFYLGHDFLRQKSMMFKPKGEANGNSYTWTLSCLQNGEYIINVVAVKYCNWEANIWHNKFSVPLVLHRNSVSCVKLTVTIVLVNQRPQRCEMCVQAHPLLRCNCWINWIKHVLFYHI